MGLETPFTFTRLSLVVLTGEKLINASKKLDQMISNQVNEGSFGAYALTACFWPGRSIEAAQAAAARKGLSQSAAAERQSLYNDATSTVAALPAEGKKAQLSLGACILHRSQMGFPDHLNHVARGRLVQVQTVEGQLWDGVNGAAAEALFQMLNKPVPEDDLREALAAFQVRPAATITGVKAPKMNADALLRALLGE